MNDSSPSSAKFREAVTVVFCCLIVASTFSWNLPASALRTKIVAITQSYMIPLGLWQEWNMFTSPQTNGFAVRLKLTDKHGTATYQHPFPDSGLATPLPNPSTNIYYNLIYDTGGLYRLNFLSYFCHQDASLQSSVLQIANLPTPDVIDGGSPDRPTPVYSNTYTVLCQ